MKNILCIFTPFSSPVSPPYSITYLAGFLKRNTNPGEFSYELLDLNAWLHHEQFKSEYAKVRLALKNQSMDDYALHAHDLRLKIENFTKLENAAVRKEENSALLQKCLNYILSRKPDVVLLSVVYNSQAFFSLQLARDLRKHDIPVIVGGPAATSQLKGMATYLPNEVSLLEHLTGKSIDHDKLNISHVLDYSGYDFSLYLAPESVICLKTSSCCYYQRCTFCTHHGFGKYIEYSMDDIRNSIVASKSKLVFFIDDMIHKKRLLELAKVTKSLGVSWMCQLRPMKELDEDTLRTLHESGLKIVLWGVESGSNRVLEMMDKGTNTADVEKVLQSSRKVGITNVTYILFGFPTETKDEFLATIDLLKRNKANIDLISTSVFGLQEGSLVFKSPKKFMITDVGREPRTMLPDKISYTVEAGLHRDDARELRQKYSKTLNSINKFPKEMNIYREHMLYSVSKTSK